MANKKIFKSYDVRGVYPIEVNEETARGLGAALVEFLKVKKLFKSHRVLVGRDARLSSDSLKQALVSGLVGQGADVVDLGRVSTPLFYWALTQKEADGGIMITASHNPALDNGFKVCLAKGEPLGSENGLFALRDLAEAGKPEEIVWPNGVVFEENLFDDYLDFIKRQADLKSLKPLKGIIDCGNGMSGPEIISLAGFLPGRCEVIFAEPDGNFPNHEANPLKEENLRDLKNKILESQADWGAAFDGDGDRVVFLDEKGEAVRGDFVTALIAQNLLQENVGDKILYEVRSSWVVPEAVTAAGGQPVLGRAGHSLMKAQMRRENILFGGELSGHYFFRSLGFLDNALVAMLEVLKIISRENKLLSEIIRPFKKYFNSGEINFSVSDAAESLVAVEKKFTGGQVKKIDGLTVEYPDWWFNLRLSNTEPLVRLNIEAKSGKLLEEKREELENAIVGK